MSSELTIALKDGLKLYYRILKTHRQKLPGQLRKIGDLYVKQEFRHHHTNPNLHYYQQFYNKWMQYYQQLNKKPIQEISTNMSPEEERLLTPDQKQALKILREEIERKKKSN